MAEITAPQIPVRFRMLSVTVERYNARPMVDNSEIELGEIDVTYAFDLDSAQRHVNAVPRFAFLDGDGEELIILQPSVLFDVHEGDWPRLVDDAGTVTLPVHLLQHLAVIATGFARGVLYEKLTREPGYGNVMLPIIPVVNYIQEDLIFSA